MSAFWTFFVLNSAYLVSVLGLLTWSAWDSVSRQGPNVGAGLGLMVVVPLLLANVFRRFGVGMYVAIVGAGGSAAVGVIVGVALGELSAILGGAAGAAFCMIAFGLFWALDKLDPRYRVASKE